MSFESLRRRDLVRESERSERELAAHKRAVARHAGPRCPACKLGAQRQRTNRSDGSHFLGCSRYPNCCHTEPIRRASRPTGPRSSGVGSDSRPSHPLQPGQMQTAGDRGPEA